MGLRSYLNEYQKKKRPGGRSFPVSQQPARPDSAAMQQRVQEYRVGLTPAEPESAPQQAPEPKTFEEWDAHLAGLENQVKTARTEADLQQMQLDAQPLRPDTADNLAEAYRRLTANRADLTDYEAKIADARKQLAAQKGAQAPDPSWWQSIVEGTPDWLKSLGGPVMEALAFGGVVGGAAAAEVGDMLGAGLTGAAGLVGWHPLEQENRIRELEKQRIAEEVVQSGGGLYDYMKARAEQFAERGADIAQPMFKWSGEAARYLVPGSGVFRDGIPALGNWIFEPEEALTPDDVDRFLGKLMVSAGADPTTYVGVGLYSRGLQLTGQGVKRLPLLAKAGTGLEKLGVGSRLLNTGKVTREGLDAMARLDAIRQVPAFAKWGDKLLAGSKIAKETFQELGPEAAEASWKSYTSALKTSQDDLLKMARTQPAAYRQRLAQALQELGPRAPKSMGDALKAANIAGDLMAPVRGQTIREQVEYGQRASLLWKPILNTVAAVDRKLPSIGKTLGWLREAVVSRVPLVGPVARVWLAGKTAADTANSELYSALYRFQDEMAALAKNVPEAKKASFAKQVTEFVETGKTSIADENAELARKYAEKFGLGAEFVRRWENVHGVPSPMLSDVVNGTLEGWLGHQFLPGFRKWLASNFKAREVLEGESWQAFDDAWKVSAVKERKLTGKTMAEAEEHLRKVLDVPPEVQIFDTNPDEILKGRFLWAGKRIEAARQLDAALKGLGQADAGAAAALKAAADAEIAEKVTGARNAVADAAKRVDAAREGEAAFVQGRKAARKAPKVKDVERGYIAANARAVRAARKAAENQLEKATQRLKEVDPAQWSAQARAEWLARVQRTAKLRLPPNMVNGLELAMKGRMALPETIDDLVRLATTGIEADTADRWLRAMPGLRNGLNAKALLGHVARFFDHLGTGIRRMILSTPTSAAKDMISTSIWLTVAAKSPESVHANMVQYLRGAVDKDAKAALEAAGALRTTRLSTEAKGHLSRAGKWIEERGLLGTIGKMGGEQVSRGAAWLPNKILDLRQKFDEAARYALYLDRKAAGYTDADAVQDVFAYLGNFNDYASGALERDVLQRFFLFWAWNRRALGFDLRALLEHPFRAKMLLMATAGNATQEHEGLDQWAASRGGFVWGKDRNGNPKLISFGAGSYMNPLWNMLESETLTNVAQGNLKGAAQATFKDVAAMANPLYGGPMELAANKDSLSGLAINRDATTDLDSRFADHAPAILSFLPKAVQDVLGFEPYEPGGKLAYYRMDPMAKWFLEWTQPGAMTFAQQLSGLVDERRTPGEALLRFGTGVPTYSMPELREDRKLDNHLRDLKLAMVKALDDVDDHPLIMQPDGQVKPNMTSKAGQKLAVAMALAEANGGDARDVLKDDQKLLAMYDLGQRLGIASSRLRRDIPEGKATLNAPTTIKQRKISLSGR